MRFGLPDHFPGEAGSRLAGASPGGAVTACPGLATRLGYKFVDTDAMIVERHGTIAQIFEKGGEGAFRQLERDTAVELAGRSGCVISTGGRFMLDEHNASVLTPTSDVSCNEGRTGGVCVGRPPVRADATPRKQCARSTARLRTRPGRGRHGLAGIPRRAAACWQRSAAFRSWTRFACPVKNCPCRLLKCLSPRRLH